MKTWLQMMVAHATYGTTCARTSRYVAKQVIKNRNNRVLIQDQRKAITEQSAKRLFQVLVIRPGANFRSAMFAGLSNYVPMVTELPHAAQERERLTMQKQSLLRCVTILN